MIGPLYVHFVPVYHIYPMHSHNLSLVEKYVIKLSYFA